MRRAFEEVARGRPKGAVWRELRPLGLATSRTRFYELLSKHFYTGTLMMPDGTARRGAWLPLVEVSVFQRVQVQLQRADKTATRAYQRLHVAFPLKGTVHSHVAAAS